MATSPPKLEETDLSRLNEKERAVLTDTNGKASVAWTMALICAAVSLFALVVAIRSGAFSPPGLASGIAKICGFVALGLWARRWSPIAAGCLLVWHLWVNFPFVSAKSFPLKLYFWVPAVVFAWAFFVARLRAAILAKAAKTGDVDGK